MDNEKLYSIFTNSLLDKLADKLNDSFRDKFLKIMVEKRERAYLKDEALAVDIANHCNLMGELCFPVYLQDGVPKIKLDNGLNHFTDEMLQVCNGALDNHMVAVYKITETDPNRIRFDYKSPHFPTEHSCTMISRYPDFSFNKSTAGRCKISDNWVRFYGNSNITKHACKDTAMTKSNNICDTHYCLKCCTMLLYYIKYVLNEYDFYMSSREQHLKGRLSAPKGEINNMELLMEQIENPIQNHLYFFLQSEKGLNHNEICTYIAQQLHKNNKISSPLYYVYDMMNLADELAKNPSGVKYEYSHLERDNLYVITGMDEFDRSFDFNNIMYKKKCEHIVRIFSEIRENRYVMVIGDQKELRKFLDLNARIDFLFKENVFELKNLTPEEMFHAFVAKSSFTTNPGFKKEFVEYIALNHNSLPIKNHELVNYLVNYCENHNALVLPPSKYKKIEIEQMLADIVGLENVKQKIDDFKKYVIFQQKAKAQGRKMQTTNFHMIYTGNPGTGKTTIARLMTTLLYQLGIIKEDKLIEVERKDLVGQYIGQTAPKTAEVIAKAMGGVLFIDEAYSLANPSGKDYGKEAIATLIKAMEDHSDNLVVIFAGYKREMEDFLNTNPGIASRIGYNFDFNDYTPEELTQIFELTVDKMGFKVSKKLLPEVIKIMGYFSSMDNFGNGRFVKKYVQETLILHSKKNPENFDTIEKEDLPTVEHMSSVVSLKDAEYIRDEYSKEDLYTFAVHEIGHAFVYHYLTKEYNFEKITISPNEAHVNGYVKYTKLMPNVRKRSDYIKVVKTFLGGMCAEIVFFGEPSDGNSQDLRMASDTVAIMMNRIGAFDDMLFVSNVIDSEKEKQLNKLLNQYYKETIAIIEENKEVVEGLAKKLLDMKNMNADDFKKYVKNGGKSLWPF